MMFVCSSQGNGPLAEIEFWRERNATLSALHEQTKLPIVRKVLDVMKESDSLLVANLQPVLTELFKFHMEASDNVRFLSTVERHFKVGWVHCSLESQPHGFNFCLFIQHLKNCSKIYITYLLLKPIVRVSLVTFNTYPVLGTHRHLLYAKLFHCPQRELNIP